MALSLRVGVMGKIMIQFVEKYGANIYSQNGEDGIISEILNRIKVKKKICVEFGGHDGKYCSNTRRLIECGWKGYMYDIDSLSPEVEEKQITPENVNDLPECSVLSIDTDGEDYRIWQAYRSKPEVVIIEINSSFPPDVFCFNSEQGCSYALMNKLGTDKGYFLVCHTGNMVFVDKKFKHLFPEITGDPVEDSELYFNKSWLNAYV